jgi:asparagine synthase (glutamine-hydrolysing)
MPPIVGNRLIAGVGLGHARLNIIDLETGDQPLANEDETTHLAINGELYDFEEIRADLESHGHAFAPRTTAKFCCISTKKTE